MGKSLDVQLEKLKKKWGVLSPNEKERKKLFSPFHQLSEQFLNDLPTIDTFDGSPSDKSCYKITGKRENKEALLTVFKTDLLKKGINAASGGHLGYIPGGGLYASAVGDYIAAISNAYSGVYYASPGSVEMEHACLNWLKSLFNYPDSAVGNLTSGGSIATLIALTAARDSQNMLGEISSSVIYMTDQTHHSVKKAFSIIGLSAARFQLIPTDGFNRMDVNVLAQRINEDKKVGFTPSLIIGNAGTTDTGAVDPLEKIVAIAEKEKCWFHVDAAYGGFFMLVESEKEKFKGIEKSDSLVCDPHKGMFLPYGTGAVLVKEKAAVFHSHKSSGNYMQDTEIDNIPINPSDVSPELTKHFRAMRMWLPLKLYGIAPFQAMLEEKLLLVHYFREKIQTLGFKTGPTPDLSITYFWYPFKMESNKMNAKLMDLCHQDGRVFLSSTLINNQFVIRMAILSFRTHKSTIDKAIAMICDSLEKLVK